MSEIPDDAVSYPTGTTTDTTGATGASGSTGYPGTVATSGEGSGGAGSEAKERVAATADEAKSQASGLKEHAKTAAGDITHQATAEIASIADEARHEARNLTSEARQQIGGQADDSARRMAALLTDAGGELRSMADRSDRPDGTLTEVIRQLGERAERTGQQLQDRGYRGLTDELTRFARNRPGTFLLAAGAAGFVVGRLLRNTDTQAIAQAAKEGGTGTADHDNLAVANQSVDDRELASTYAGSPYTSGSGVSGAVGGGIPSRSGYAPGYSTTALPDEDVDLVTPPTMPTEGAYPLTSEDVGDPGRVR